MDNVQSEDFQYLVYLDLGYETHTGHVGVSSCKVDRKTRRVELSCLYPSINLIFCFTNVQ